MNIIEIPQDHKQLIYYLLTVEDLSNLGKTCKTFYYDEQRKKFCVLKIVDSYFYSSLDSSNFNLNCKKVREMYFQRLQEIRFQNPRINKIDFSLDHYLQLEISTKYLICENISKYLCDIWIYSEKDNCLEYGILYYSLENILKDIFTFDSNIMRIKILDEFNIRMKGYRSKYSLYDFNQIFLSLLNYSYWKDLDKIIEISDLIETYNIEYLYAFLYAIFQPFIDIEYNIEHDKFINQFENQLYESYNKHKTYYERLMELFTISNYMIHDYFNESIDFRKERWFVINDDYDY